MSTLKVNNIKDVSGGGQPDIIGVAKAFVNFNGAGTVAIRSAFNVASITDLGVGNFNLNFETPLPSENPAVQVTAWSPGVQAHDSGYSLQSVYSVGVITTNPTGNAQSDPTDISVTLFSN